MRRHSHPATRRSTFSNFANRGVAIVAFVLVAGAVVGAMAGAGTGELLYRLIVDGLPLAAWLLAGFGIAATVLARSRSLDNAPTLLRTVVVIALGLGVIGVAVLLLGLAGAFNQIAAVVILVVGVALALWRVGARVFAASPTPVVKW